MNRRKFIKTTSVTALAGTIPLLGQGFYVNRTASKLHLAEVRDIVGRHLEKLCDKGGPYGSYRSGIGKRPDLYSSCDVAQIRTIWGEDLQKTLSVTQRTDWINHINSFADKSDGSYFDRFNHSKLHANGMTIGALGVLGGKQKYPVKLYNDFNTEEKVIPWLEQINWGKQWGASHLFWGGIHCYSLSKHCSKKWLNVVFNWLDKNVDPHTGWWRKNTQYADRHQPLGGSVHILPIYQHHNRTFPYPEKVIDSVLALQLTNKRWLNRNRPSDKAYMHYLELDALYALKYMQILAPEYRIKDIHNAVLEYGKNVITYWNKSKQELLLMHLHRILSAIGTFGLLQHHLHEMFFDDVIWSDIFSDIRFYQTNKVEVN